jgi:glycosyltransferase involved in cell wall biosynthesis
MPAAHEPSVSVVVPSYNHARFLRRRVDSILGQTRQDFELLLLDDASTDGSAAIADEYAGDARVRVEHNRNNSGSPFPQWNRGARLARGDYLWFAESDDWAEPHFLERMVPVLERNPGVGLVHCQFRVVDEGGRQLRDPAAWWDDLDPTRWRRDFVAPGRDELRFLGDWNVISNASAVVLRRSVFLAAGGADESFKLAADWLLWIRMLTLADVGFVAEPLTSWRWHSGTVRERAARDGSEQHDVARALAAFAAATGTPVRTVEAGYHRRTAAHAIAGRDAAAARRHALASLVRAPGDLRVWRTALRALALSLR